MSDQNEARLPQGTLGPYVSDLSERLRKIIEEQGTNARAVADKAGLGPTYVRDITHGKVKSPTYAKLRQVADVLGVSVEYLTTGAPHEGAMTAEIDGPERSQASRTPKFTIEGELVHIEATLDREGVERLKAQLDHILSLLA